MLYRLHKAGYAAYLVGGSVRDLLLGREPKDFDVVTDAHPEEIKQLFRNCRLIGRRFRLAHVVFGREVIEVATFRAGPDRAPDDEDEARGDTGMLLQDNVYGTIDDDAARRDFAINALYYNIADFSVVDYAGGLADLRGRRIRMLGDPELRYREDPVRMLRAVRFAAKLGFEVEPLTAAPFEDLVPLLRHVPPARLFDEVLKLFMSGHALASLEALDRFGMLGELFPAAARAMEAEDVAAALLRGGMRATDARIAEGKPVTPAYLFAVLLWPAVLEELAEVDDRHRWQVGALQAAGDAVTARQIQRVTIPKRFSLPMREIWTLQARFQRRHGKRVWRLLDHSRFRAGLDFLSLRAASGEPVAELSDWWQQFAEADESRREAMMTQLKGSGGKSGKGGKPRRRRRGGRRQESA